MGVIKFLDGLHNARGPLDPFEAPKAPADIDLRNLGSSVAPHAVEVDYVPTEAVAIDVASHEADTDLTEPADQVLEPAE